MRSYFQAFKNSMKFFYAEIQKATWMCSCLASWFLCFATSKIIPQLCLLFPFDFLMLGFDSTFLWNVWVFASARHILFLIFRRSAIDTSPTVILTYRLETIVYSDACLSLRFIIEPVPRLCEACRVFRCRSDYAPWPVIVSPFCEMPCQSS